MATQTAYAAAVPLQVRETARSEPRVKQAHYIRPLEDPRWDAFVQKQVRASAFHSSAWLSALSRTYGYLPIAFTTTPAGPELENAMVFCQVESLLTGRRLVSVPFSDHCEALVETKEDSRVLAAALGRELSRGGWRYLEVRSPKPFEMLTGFHRMDVPYAFHQVDLTSDLGTIFRNCHKDSTQRKIRRAEREGLTCSEGSNAALLDQFYELFTVTRKRHKLPPPPRKWFANLMGCFGDALKIRVAFHHRRPISSIVTIRHKDTLVYKYGCCDSRFTRLGSMHFLIWKAIEDAKASGLHFLDLGRTDADQRGLITFKNRWGATQSTVTYSRFSASERCMHFFDLSANGWKVKTARYITERIPCEALAVVGKLLYRHVG